MSSAPAISEFPAPVPSDFWQPFAVLEAWSPPLHRNARRVERDAQVLISQLEFVAKLQHGFVVNDGGPDVPEAMKRPGLTQEDLDEEMLELLRAMRALYSELTSGSRVRKVKRDVERFAPHLKARLQSSIDAAREQVAQNRAFVAFLANEHVVVDLDVELVPEAGEPMEPEDSYPPQ
jgi:hypothetical protein